MLGEHTVIASTIPIMVAVTANAATACYKLLTLLRAGVVKQQPTEWPVCNSLSMTFVDVCRHLHWCGPPPPVGFSHACYTTRQTVDSGHVP